MNTAADLLIDATELYEQLQGACPPVVADCRFSMADPGAGEIQFRAGHLPGASYLHLDRDLSAPRTRVGGRHPLPSAEDFAERMRRIGLSAERMLVAYDDSRSAFASRLWWLARYFGHANVRVLDGGFRAWCDAGLPVDTQAVAPAPGDFTARPDMARTIDYEALSAALSTGGLVLVDSREPARYRGLEELIDPVAGRIPGAVNRPWIDVTEENGRFRDPVVQAERWAGLGAPERMVVYCGSGVTACLNLLSLELAGIRGARLYPGSWSDWCVRPGAGVERDPEIRSP